MMRTELARTV